jgi:hypothetical protein
MLRKTRESQAATFVLLVGAAPRLPDQKTVLGAPMESSAALLVSMFASRAYQEVSWLQIGKVAIFARISSRAFTAMHKQQSASTV